MEIIFNQALIAHQEDRLEEAEHLYRKTLEAESNNPIANNNLGIILKNDGRLDEAEASFKRAINIKPDFAEAYNNLGNTISKLNKIDEALTCYKKATEIKPDYNQAHYNLGTTLHTLEKIDEAETSFKRTIELKPNYTKAHFNLGVIQSGQDKHKEAEISFRKTIELKPDYAEAYNNLGIALQEQDMFEEAEISFKKAIEVKPDFAEAHNNLSITLRVLGKLDEAEISYKKLMIFNYEKAKAFCENFSKKELIEYPEKSAFVYKEVNQRGFFLENNYMQKNFLLPILSWPFLDFIQTLDLKNVTLHELGSGNSTIWFSNIFKFVESYETNEDWYKELKPKLNNNVSLRLTNLENIYDCLIKFKSSDWLLIDFAGKRTKFIHKLCKLTDNEIPAQIILDNSNWYRNGAKILIERGYMEIPFYGFNNSSISICSTSLFLLKGIFKINNLSEFHSPKYAKRSKNIWDTTE